MEKRAVLSRQFGLRPQVVPTIEAFSAPDASPKPPAGPQSPVARRPLYDGSRTRAEARLALPDADEDGEEIASPTRRFSLLDITSGPPDDSREADERATERRLRDLRGRVKVARATVSSTPGLLEVLQRDWKRAAQFYGRCDITGIQFRHCVRSSKCPSEEDSSREPPANPVGGGAEAPGRGEATFPETP